MAKALSGNFQDKLIVAMVVALMMAVGGVGYLYGQLTAIRGGTGLGGDDKQVVQAPTAAAAPAPTNVDEATWQEVMKNGVAERGSGDAKVTMVEFTDFQCPYCKRHFDETEPLIVKDYIDAGKIKYIVHDLPLPFHPNAHIAAEAARCAADQNKYWEMHDTLFAKQDEWANSSDPKSAFSDFAGEVEINVANFDACVASGKHKQAVDDDLALANKAGATGTPTFVVNGELLVGAQPYASFQAVLDKALSQ